MVFPSGADKKWDRPIKVEPDPIPTVEVASLDDDDDRPQKSNKGKSMTESKPAPIPADEVAPLVDDIDGPNKTNCKTKNGEIIKNSLKRPKLTTLSTKQPGPGDEEYPQVTSIKSKLRKILPKPGHNPKSITTFSKQESLLGISAFVEEPFVVEDSNKMMITPTVANVSQQQEEERAIFYESLYKSGVRCAVLSSLKGYATDYFKKSFNEVMPDPLPVLLNYTEASAKMSFDQIIVSCKRVFEKLYIDEEEAVLVEMETREVGSKTWLEQRAARVPADLFKSATEANLADTSTHQLIKQICYDNGKIRYGCEHEKQALKLYIQRYSVSHQDFTVTESGLLIQPEFQHLCGSPDGVTLCKCCGAGCLVIKCQYCRDDFYQVHVEEDHGVYLCLMQDESVIPKLKKDHSYYYEIQALLNIMDDVNFCDFIQWKGDTIAVERIAIDETFFISKLQKVNEFYINGIMPELFGKYYSNLEALTQVSSPETEACCFCQQPPSGEMLFCHSEGCKIRLFHTQCLRLKNRPSKDWHCPFCQKLARQSKKGHF